MASVGEEVVGAWLRMVAGCDFVQYNVPTRDRPGEIDVIGLDLATETAYVCEVATHLVTGLQYVTNNEINNVVRLTNKFQNDVEYTRKYLPDFEHRFMLWTPILKLPVAENAKHNQFKDVRQIRRNLMNSHEAEIEIVANEAYKERVDELIHQASRITTASEFSVFRALQIITAVEKHVENLQERGINTGHILQTGKFKRFKRE